jgi:hypothetical protein
VYENGEARLRRLDVEPDDGVADGRAGGIERERSANPESADRPRERHAGDNTSKARPTAGTQPAAGYRAPNRSHDQLRRAQDQAGIGIGVGKSTAPE